METPPSIQVEDSQGVLDAVLRTRDSSPTLRRISMYDNTLARAAALQADSSSDVDEDEKVDLMAMRAAVALSSDDDDNDDDNEADVDLVALVAANSLRPAASEPAPPKSPRSAAELRALAAGRPASSTPSPQRSAELSKKLKSVPFSRPLGLRTFV